MRSHFIKWPLYQLEFEANSGTLDVFTSIVTMERPAGAAAAVHGSMTEPDPQAANSGHLHRVQRYKLAVP